MYLKHALISSEISIYSFSTISGKSLLMKERSIRAKNQGRNVTFMSLGSCDVFGSPFELSMVYDLITKREMKQFGIKFLNSIDLLNLCGSKETYEDTGDDIRKFVVDIVGKVIEGKISGGEFEKGLRQHGIDIGNAIEYYHESKKNLLLSMLENVYNLLIEYCKRNNQEDINIDEFPVLLNYSLY